MCQMKVLTLTKS